MVGKIAAYFGGNRKEIINNFFRKCGVKIGKNATICCNMLSSEPYLINIGDNVTISNDVQIITHDNSIIKITKGEKTDIFGEVVIGNNCFIGARSIIMYGVTLTNNIIVAAGSVVTKSFYEPYTIIGGNPAKKIGSWDAFFAKNQYYAHNVKGFSYNQKRDLLSDKSKIIGNK
ncbi:MAG: hypothetical protein JL56_15700 [Desulfotomaculum sp. BICA1-6]|nr:MAG: hypothetical protein JL56_15700 [Desulfotomaculum sp. BICA1-6]